MVACGLGEEVSMRQFQQLTVYTRRLSLDMETPIITGSTGSQTYLRPQRESRPACNPTSSLGYLLIPQPPPSSQTDVVFSSSPCNIDGSSHQHEYHDGAFHLSLPRWARNQHRLRTSCSFCKETLSLSFLSSVWFLRLHVCVRFLLHWA